MKKSKANIPLLRNIRKIVRIMKIAAVLVFLLSFHSFANTYGQNIKMNISMENATFKEVIERLEKESGYYVVIRYDQTLLEKKVDIDFQNSTVTEILDGLLKDTGLGYKIIDRYIAISTINELNSASQQQKTVTGKVTDQSGATLPGVSVVVKGTTIGVITDGNGSFSLANIPVNATLQFSFVGMKSQEISVGSQTIINLILADETIGLEEVVAIGYGTQKKATITGSVSTVSGDKLQVANSANFTNTLVGRLPGLVAVTPSGYPGADDAMLRIRGNNTLNDNSPLIVVDGIANRSMSRLNSSEIESVIVLKDASAAIYGAQAANGVILITTKRGSTGKLKVQVGFNQGFSSPTVIPKMADSYLFATMMNEIDSYEGHSGRYSATDLQKYKDGSDPWGHPNTDWYKEVYKPLSLENNANINLSGGTESLKYYVSIGTKHQDGMWKKSAANYSQADFRSNIDAKVSKNITVSLDLAGRQENRNSPYFSEGEIVEYILRSKPTDHAWWFNGLPAPGVEGIYNPAVLVTDQTGYNADKRYIMESNLKLNINIPWVKGLSVSGNASIDKNFQTVKGFQVPYYLYAWDGVTLDTKGLPLLNGSKSGTIQPALTQSTGNGQQITLTGLVNYERRIAENHKIKILVGSESNVGEQSNFWASRKYFISDAIPELFAGADLEKDNNGLSVKNARLNYFGRVNYDYLSKYLLEFVWRYDGSYKFPADKQWGFFPGFSAGWVISEEKFFKNNLAFFNYFKLRGSWGQTGNDRISAFQYLSTYGFGSPWILYGSRGDQWVTNRNVINKILQESQIPNLNITWEVANQTDIGFDTQMFRGKLKFEGDYFYNLRTHILTQRNASVPASTGLTLPPENIGEVVNQGFEFLVSYSGKSGNFGYNVSLNGGYAKNKIKFWDETPGIPDYQLTTGYPMNSGLYYQAIGIFKDQAAIDAYPHWVGARPGDIIFKDVNDDKKIDGLDMVRDYRSDIPNFTAGLNIDLTYKNFYATVLFQGAWGKMRYKYYSPGDGGNFRQEEAVGRWTVDNPNATKPRAFNYYNDYWRLSSNPNTYWLQNADYVRLKNFEIGYNMPKSVNTILGIDGLRIYVGGTNLITWSPGIKDYDPESIASSAGSVAGDYPLAKVINIGATITF